MREEKPSPSLAVRFARSCCFSRTLRPGTRESDVSRVPKQVRRDENLLIQLTISVGMDKGRGDHHALAIQGSNCLLFLARSVSQLISTPLPREAEWFVQGRSFPTLETTLNLDVTRPAGRESIVSTVVVPSVAVVATNVSHGVSRFPTPLRPQVSMNGLNERTLRDIRSAVENPISTAPGAFERALTTGVRGRRSGGSLLKDLDLEHDLEAGGDAEDGRAGRTRGGGSRRRAREMEEDVSGRRFSDEGSHGSMRLGRYSPPSGEVELEIFGRKVASFGEVSVCGQARWFIYMGHTNSRLCVSSFKGGDHLRSCIYI